MRVSIIGFTARGCDLAKRVSDILEDCDVKVFCRTSADVRDVKKVTVSMEDWTRNAFSDSDAIVFVGAAGIAIRYIAPFIKDKTVDPAVVCIDEMGRFSIPLISGHIGGANDLAKRIADAIGAIPVMTTATDINGKISIDSYAVKNDMHIGSMPIAKDVSARILDGGTVCIASDMPLGEIPPELTMSDSGELGIYISYRTGKGPFSKTLKLTPRCHVLGIGCRRDTPTEAIEDMVMNTLRSEDISLESIRSVASIDLKKDEKGLTEFCGKYGLDAVFFSASDLNALPDIGYSESEMVKKVTGVGNVCERAAMAGSRDGELVLRKQARDGVTVAIARDGFVLGPMVR